MVNTRIVIDLIDNFNIILLQALVFCYRHYWFPTKVLPNVIFEPVFAKHSKFFNELKNTSFDQNYWRDLVYLHRDENVGLHFLVNMMTFPDTAYD